MFAESKSAVLKDLGDFGIDQAQGLFLSPDIFVDPASKESVVELVTNALKAWFLHSGELVETGAVPLDQSSLLRVSLDDGKGEAFTILLPARYEGFVGKTPEDIDNLIAELMEPTEEVIEKYYQERSTEGMGFFYRDGLTDEEVAELFEEIDEIDF
jgi:hypothetical protein